MLDGYLITLHDELQPELPETVQRAMPQQLLRYLRRSGSRISDGVLETRDAEIAAAVRRETAAVEII